MRKTRKVIADVTASPSPVSPPSPQTDDQQPLCMFCGKAPAKLLNVTHSRTPEVTAFCCVTCAATWAIIEVKRHRLTWCIQHKQWHRHDAGCHRCRNKTEAERRDAYLKATGARPDEKGVDGGK